MHGFSGISDCAHCNRIREEIEHTPQLIHVVKYSLLSLNYQKIFSILNKVAIFVCFIKCTENGIHQERKILKKYQALFWNGSD